MQLQVRRLIDVDCGQAAVLQEQCLLLMTQVAVPSPQYAVTVAASGGWNSGSSTALSMLSQRCDLTNLQQ